MATAARVKYPAALLCYKFDAPWLAAGSLTPFILDGDRTPSRLDPFGSSDRRMEYYFLGEEGKEESTGYLFMELKKENTGQYRTIGIGQRAQKGKPIGFWGFVIMDGRRIGYDLWLYREVGKPGRSWGSGRKHWNFRSTGRWRH